MYRDKIIEIFKSTGLTMKEWSEQSGVSVDTINRVTNPENPDKDSPRVNTLENMCKPLGVELWEIFFMGDKSFVSMQAEINTLKDERDALLADNAILKDKIENLRDRVDTLIDLIIKTQSNYIKQKEGI